MYTGQGLSSFRVVLTSAFGLASPFCLASPLGLPSPLDFASAGACTLNYHEYSSFTKTEGTGVEQHRHKTLNEHATSLLDNCTIPRHRLNKPTEV